MYSNMVATNFHPQPSHMVNNNHPDDEHSERQQLINLQGNTAAIVGADTPLAEDSQTALEAFEDAAAISQH